MFKAWTLVTWGLALVGVVVAASSQPTAAVLTTAFLGALTGYCIRMGFYAGVTDPPTSLVRITRFALRDAVYGAFAFTALIGLAELGLPVLLVALVIVVGGGGWLWSESRRGDGGWEHERISVPAGSAQPTVDTATLRSTSQLTTDELLTLWTRSLAALQTNTDVAATLAVVEARQACLDEFERRDPAALQRWLAQRPRAAGNPTRYMKRTA